ncbi:MAG: hypothetical protein A2270_10300 [Elusimicrobia bacterium RIFOXYA12_FULL_51_18]|nr:MAG: hypothetical protein A2270_10300 [Elusimicrobia bacterium RIFOXYA12_FULL_51_18]OGS29544.1 MAG: hypothetical protein A2218_00890 [Elusimicrobia bacterium RIFOXYA2_FULL_53_38]
MFLAGLSIPGRTGEDVGPSGQNIQKDAGINQRDIRSDHNARLEKINKIDLEIFDIEAMYWAWRIKDKDTTYYDLLDKSKRWIILAETKNKLFAKIQENLDTGTVRALTAAEQDKLDDAKSRIRAILSDGAPEHPGLAAQRAQMAKVDEIDKEILDIRARYWAFRIKNDGDVTYDTLLAYSKKWVGIKETTTKLMEKIKGLLAGGDITPLDELEHNQLDDAHARIRAILR